MTLPSQENRQSPQQPSLDLIYALNSIALALQESIHSEEKIYAVFQKQVVALGLRGGISELDEAGENLLFKTVAFTNPLRKILGRFERQVKTRAEGYSVLVDRVDVYRKVTRQGLSVFVPDTSSVAAQVVPDRLKGVVRPLMEFLGRPPASSRRWSTTGRSREC